jgi:hypothetical protein
MANHMEVGFATDVTRDPSFSPLVSFASQRASEPGYYGYHPHVNSSDNDFEKKSNYNSY